MGKQNLLKITKVLILCMFYFSTDSFAQSGAEENQNVNFKNWRILLQVNGPTDWNASLNAVKPICSKWALRFGVSPIISFDRTKGNEPTSTIYVFYKDAVKAKKLGAEFSLGAEYHLLKNSKVDPYVLMGSGISAFVQVVTRETNYELQVPDASGLVEFKNDTKTKGAPRVSFNPFVGFGFNYFFHPRMAIGAEYSIGPNMILVKGNNTIVSNDSGVYDTGDEVAFTTEYKEQVNAFYLNVNQQVGLHFIFIVDKDRN